MAGGSFHNGIMNVIMWKCGVKFLTASEGKTLFDGDKEKVKPGRGRKSCEK